MLRINTARTLLSNSEGGMPALALIDWNIKNAAQVSFTTMMFDWFHLWIVCMFGLNCENCDAEVNWDDSEG